MINAPEFVCKVCGKIHPSSEREANNVWILPKTITTNQVNSSSPFYFCCLECVDKRVQYLDLKIFVEYLTDWSKPQLQDLVRAAVRGAILNTGCSQVKIKV